MAFLGINLGRVKNYDEMLNRIWFFVSFMGCIYFLFLLYIPEINNFYNFIAQEIVGKYEIKDEMEIGGLKGPISTALKFLTPLLVAFLFRILKLHDRISDLLKIRNNFDVNYILTPMAERVGITVNKNLTQKIKKNRRSLMNKVFYEYASSKRESVVDNHLIEKALDTWSWFWAFLETSILALISIIISLIYNQMGLFWIFLISFVIWTIFFNIYRIPCPKNASSQVNVIISDSKRSTKIKSIFNAL